MKNLSSRDHPKTDSTQPSNSPKMVIGNTESSTKGVPKIGLESLPYDLASGFVVFLVALPLCLGIAHASDAPAIAGLITGIIAGVVVSFLSGSELSISGPAAGLTITLITVQRELGSFEGLLVAGMVAGVIQVLLGALRTGLLAAFFPSSVIKGMLAGIGILIMLKQLPHAVGWRGEYYPEDGLICVISPFCLHGLVGELTQPHSPISLGALIISITGVAILSIYNSPSTLSSFRLLKRIPGPLVVVLLGVIANSILSLLVPSIAASHDKGQLVSIPELKSISDLFIHGPSSIIHWLSLPELWSSAITIALIASVETLLCIEATDKLDPFRRVSRPNRELIAQGIGNLLSGIFGGIPMTSVIVRSSANVYAGARTRLSGAFHGLFLLLSVIAIPTLLNQIPLAALAAILIMVGYKLANLDLFKNVWRAGLGQFLPFIVTVIGVVTIDLLTGVIIGTIIGLIVVLMMNHHAAFTVIEEESNHYLRFAKDVSFLQKISLKRTLAQIPDNSHIVVDGGSAMFVDHDILELIDEFRQSSAQKGITIELRNIPNKRLNFGSILRRLGSK